MSKQPAKPDAHAEGDQAPAGGIGALIARFRSLSHVKIRNILVTSLALFLTSVVVYVLNRDPGLTPAEQLQLALTKLDERKNAQAREIAKALEATGFHDPSFAGGTEFILGIAAFREAAGVDETSR